MSTLAIFRRHPFVTWLLIAALALIYCFEAPAGHAREMIQVPATTLLRLGALNAPSIDRGEYFRFMFAPLLHASALHLLTNMISLAVIGALVERRLTRSALVSIFALGALVGCLASYWFSDPRTVSVGASGGIMALAAVALLVVPPSPEEGKERLKILLWMIPSLIPMLPLGIDRVDQSAHIAGALTGLTIGAAIVATVRSPSIVRIFIIGFRIIAVVVLASLALMAPKGYRLWKNAMVSGYQLKAARNARLAQRYDLALQDYHLILNRDPDDVAARVEFAETLAATGRHERALREFQLAGRQDPGAARAAFNQGVTIFNKGSPRTAEAYFRISAYMDPALIQAWENLILCLTMRKNYGLAQQELERAMNENPGSSALRDRYLQLKAQPKDGPAKGPGGDGTLESQDQGFMSTF